MGNIISFIENLLSEKTLEVSLGAGATSWLASHNLSTVAVAVLVAVLGSLGVHVGGALSSATKTPSSPPPAA